MLSFLNSVAASNNGKTGPTGETVKNAVNGDTSGEERKKLPNRTTADKKRRKGKQHTPVTKIAKLMAAVPTDTTATLESIGIIIPKILEIPKEDEEKILEIPSMNSPLFKDIPFKQTESSSDLTSSSEGSSSSNDSSSSDNDSDDDIEEKNTNLPHDTLTSALEEEPSKLRIPIKLTISNLGKQSAKVVTKTSGEATDTISSDSEIDLDYNETERMVKVQTNPPLEGNKHESLNNSQTIDNSDQSDFQNNWLTEPQDNCGSHMRHIELINQYQNHSRFTNINKDVGNIKANCYDLDINDSVDKNQKSANSDLNFATTKNDQNDEILENFNSTIISSKNVIDVFKNGNIEGFEMEKPFNGKFVNHDTKNTVGSMSSSKEIFPTEDMCMKPKVDSELLRDISVTSYCPDGFIMTPALSTSPEHLKTTVRNSQNHLDSVKTKDGSSNDILEADISSKTDTVYKTEELKPSKNDCKQTTLDNPTNSVQENCKINIQTENQNSTKDETLNNISEKEKSEMEKCNISEMKDNNVSLNIQNCSDGNSKKSIINTKCDELSHEIIHNKISIEAAKISGPKCKDTAASSQSLLRNAATKITTSITVNSGSVMSATSKNSSKIGGCTNGIPDKENPFITWTKCDANNYGSVDTSLPATSLVQALARVPFPTLSPHGESSISQISPLGVAVPQLSPLCLAGLSPGGSQLSRMSPCSQMPILSPSSSHRLRSSPSISCVRQQMSSGGQIHTGSDDGNSATLCEEGKIKPTQKSGKRTSRLSNIIDSLRTSKEKEAAETNLTPEEQNKKSTPDTLTGTERKSPSLELSSLMGRKSSSSSSSSSPIFSASFGTDSRSSNDKMLLDSLGFPHQISTDPCHLITSTLGTARAQTVDYSFHALKDNLDKEKIMLENLEMMKSGLLDPYSQLGLLDPKSRKLDSGHSQNHSKSSSFSSSSVPILSAPSLSSRPSSRQSKSSSQIYPSASSSSPRTNSTITTSTSNQIGGSINNAMFHLAPSPALSAAHMELNAAAANILNFQHMYGMQDPYMMKTLMSNPLYLQRMMEFQKQAMDPLLLRQLEMYEAAAAAENSKNNKEQQAMHAQSLLWQAHAASIIQHQHMQQIQQLQLHHQQQQLQQQVAAVRERETRETIAAIITSKNNNFSTYTNKSSGSISTGQSAKSLMASVSATSSSSTLSSSKRPRSMVTPSSTDIYSRGFPSLEKKIRPSHNSSHISNHTNYTSASSLSNASSPSSFRHAQMSNKPASSNEKQYSSSNTSSTHSKHEFLDLPTALHLSATASPQMWGYPSLDMTHMSRFFELSNDTKPSAGPGGSEASGPEVLDLSVKPRIGKT